MELVYAVLALCGAGLFVVGWVLGCRHSVDVGAMYAAGWRAAVRELQTCPGPDDDDEEEDGDEAWKRGERLA